MLKRLIALLVMALLLSGGVSHADRNDFVFFDLSLAGYCIGMTYDEATAVRPFHYTEDVVLPSEEAPYFIGVVENLSIDAVDVNLAVYFKEGRIQKIITRFHPAGLEQMIQSFKQTLGRGKDKSRTLVGKNGAEIKQSVYYWSFPSAEMHLIGLSSNTEFATASLVAKKTAQPETEAEAAERE